MNENKNEQILSQHSKTSTDDAKKLLDEAARAYRINKPVFTSPNLYSLIHYLASLVLLLNENTQSKTLYETLLTEETPPQKNVVTLINYIADMLRLVRKTLLRESQQTKAEIIQKKAQQKLLEQSKKSESSPTTKFLEKLCKKSATDSQLIIKQTLDELLIISKTLYYLALHFDPNNAYVLDKLIKLLYYAEDYQHAKSAVTALQQLAEKNNYAATCLNKLSKTIGMMDQKTSKSEKSLQKNPHEAELEKVKQQSLTTNLITLFTLLQRIDSNYRKWNILGKILNQPRRNQNYHSRKYHFQNKHQQKKSQHSHTKQTNVEFITNNSYDPENPNKEFSKIFSELPELINQMLAKAHKQQSIKSSTDINQALRQLSMTTDSQNNNNNNPEQPSSTTNNLDKK
jgi:hypothetical protein